MRRATCRQQRRTGKATAKHRMSQQTLKDKWRLLGWVCFTQICVGPSQQLFELIQTGCFPLGHGRGARCVLVSHASHERDDRRPVGQRALSVEGCTLTGCIWWEDYKLREAKRGYINTNNNSATFMNACKLYNVGDWLFLVFWKWTKFACKTDAPLKI